jgi:DNA-binding transcriptional LysR family regulator
MSDDYLAVQAFVAAGLGVAMVPGLVASRRIAGVQVRCLRGATHRQRSSARTADRWVCVSAFHRCTVERVHRTLAEDRPYTMG